ncbi:hypothetical protein B0H14DRAFT_2344102 [Mycena olivaceomarginata]|nr:hypothetical protein B0H14DRAFT_2365123 [Mycena olivaceomarginata]KAJ7873611.1 hypothetical protein B0H14DRAFT_2344102 [Mycena olivaceomarginata]
MRAVIARQTQEIGVSSTHREGCRTIMMQIVNALTSKLEIGSPMASLYLLGNLDHYTNHEFNVCWWKAYVCLKRWLLWMSGRREGVSKGALPHAGTLLGVAGPEKSHAAHTVDFTQGIMVNQGQIGPNLQAFFGPPKFRVN